MKTSTLTLLVLCVVSCSKLSESEQYREALAIDNPSERAVQLNKFIAAYPAGEDASSARSKLVDAWIEAQNESEAVAAARHYLDSLSGRRYVSGMVNVLNELAYKGLALDTVLAWAKAIEPAADTTHRYYWASARNAQATVLLHRGQLADALNLQRSAVEKYDDEPEFLRNLAVLEFNQGESLPAMARVAPLAIDGDGEALNYFLTWTESLPADRRRPVRDSIALGKARIYVDSLHSENKRMAKSTGAIFLARCGTATDLAESWSAEPLSDPNLTASEEIEYRKNRGFVLAALGKNGEALDMLRSIADVMDPWNPIDLLTYGALLESVSKNRDALDLYATGMLAEEGEKIKAAFLSAYTKEFGSSKGARAFLEGRREALENFQPPHRKPGKSSKVVLAELFTGAECGPCVSADLAFDALAEYYERTEVAILEYHLHIPRPDPMTNNDGWNRYQYYGGNFGTPTTIVDGIDQTIGGGPKFVKRNRFFFFDRMIQRHTTENPTFTMSVQTEVKEDVIEATAVIKSVASRPLMVNMALAEKTVEYKGGNGIFKHRFVVRAVSDSGLAQAESIGPASTVTKQFNLSDIASQVNDQIEKPHEQISWGSRKSVKPDWKNPPPTFDKNNLVLVVWLQDPETKKIVQAAYRDLQ